MCSGCIWGATWGLYAFVFARSRCSLLPHYWASLQYSSRTRVFRIHLCILLCYHCIDIFSPVSLTHCFSTRRILTLMPGSDAIYLFCLGHDPVRDLTRPRLLLSLDIRRFRQRKLLLCHHSRLESRPVGDCRGLTVRGPSRRVGGRKARDERQRYQTDIVLIGRTTFQCNFIQQLFVSSAVPSPDSWTHRSMTST